MVIPPKYNVSEVIEQIKAQSASRLEENIFLGIQDILERDFRLVIRVRCFNSRYR